MTGREAYTIWAPPGALWVDWVRPVAFVAGGDQRHPGPPLNLTLPAIQYLDGPRRDTAVVVDLPGYDGVKEGIALAGLGFRPIPLYNGTAPQAGAMALVSSDKLNHALRWGASELEKLTIPADAPPAFLLDSNRTHQYRMDISLFDNSWDIYGQDMPSADYLGDKGIRRVIVRGDRIRPDLAKILYPYQNRHIAITHTTGFSPPRTVKVKRPARERG